MGELGIAFCMGLGFGCIITAVTALGYPMLCTIADNARERRLIKECELVDKKVTHGREDKWHV